MKSILLGLLLSASAIAKPYSCFSEHVREAIRLNEERMPLYSSLSYGESRELSKDLIFTERTTWVAAKGFEIFAKKYWKAGIPVLCADFVPMSQTPAFKKSFDHDAPKEADYRRPDVDRWVDELHESIKMGFTTTHATALRLLKEVESPKGFHCMAKHVLESIARVAYLAPQYETRAKAAGLVSPGYLERNNLKLHLQGLKAAVGFDERAAPLQARGIPILCQDVPPLDVSPRLP